MSNKVIFLRICYWFGAALDGVMVLPMLSPAIGGAVFGIPDFHPGSDYRYAMMVGASLMLGWAFLLVWADRKPLERKGVILITAFPVVIGMVLAGDFAVSRGLVRPGRMLPAWILQGILLCLFLFSYLLNSLKGSQPDTQKSLAGTGESER